MSSIIELAILTLCYLFIPLIIILLVNKYSIFRKISGIVLAYIVGLILGNSGLIDKTLYNFQETFSGIAVLLAIPMLLFTVNIRSLAKTTAPVLKCLLGGLFAVVITVAAGYLIWSNNQPEMWKTSGMLVGVYTGGTPNLASIQAALDVKPEQFILLNTYDILLSSVFLLFIFTLGKPLLGSFLGLTFTEETFENYAKTKQDSRNKFQEILSAIGASLLIVAFSVGISLIIKGKIDMLIVILGVTSISLISSLTKKLNANTEAFPTGMYFIYVFSVAVASMADISTFKNIAPTILNYTSFVVFGSLLIHILWCRIFKLSGDLLMVTSVALICSPPFVPMLANKIKNKNLIAGGLTVGLIGYAIGNYLGISIAYILKSI